MTDKEAFEEWFKSDCHKAMNGKDAWNAALAYRDAQVGELTKALEDFADETQEFYVDHYKDINGIKVGIIKDIVQLANHARRALINFRSKE